MVTVVVLGREEGEVGVLFVSLTSSSSSAAVTAAVVAANLDVEETGVLLLDRIRREFLLVL